MENYPLQRTPYASDLILHGEQDCQFRLTILHLGTSICWSLFTPDTLFFSI